MQFDRMGLEDNKGFREGLRAAANRCETQGALRFMKLKLCKFASFRSCEPVIP